MQGTPIFHGPGSAFGTGLLQSRRPRQEFRSISNEKLSSIPRIVLRECIELFFHWQLPYSALLDRQTFMRHWNGGSDLSAHFSSAVLYSVCALGALMSADRNIRLLAETFAAVANEELTSESCWSPQLGTCQALLLCAVFDLGRGNSSKAWIKSGKNS